MTVAVEVIPGYCVDETCQCHVTGHHDSCQQESDGLPPGCCNRCGRRGPKPLTIVPPAGHVTLDQMAARIIKTREENGELLQKYHQVWYDSGHTWPYTHFLGIGCMKCPNDLWIYQSLISENKPQTIIETGTYSGASALWFAFIMDMLGIEGGKILTIDIDDHLVAAHPRIHPIRGSSVDPGLAAAVLAEVEGPLMLSLDSDHSADHVRKELELYAPAVQLGGYCIVEDTNIGWDGPGGDRGARGGVSDYVLAHEGEWMQDVLCERYLLTMNPGGWLKRVAECPHKENR